MKYQLFSERCSGSNYVEKVLQLNFPELEPTYEYGFKHWLHPRLLNEEDFPDDLLYIVICRNPFDWLRSMHHQPWHAGKELRHLPFSRFIRSEWFCIWDEQACIDKNDPRWMREMMEERNPFNSGRRFKNILEVRKVKYTTWKEKLGKHPKFARINYDQFYRNPRKKLEEISAKGNLQSIGNPKTKVGYKGNFSWKRRLLRIGSLGLLGNYRRRPNRPISSADLNFISSQLDPRIEEFYGHDIDTILRREAAFS